MGTFLIVVAIFCVLAFIGFVVEESKPAKGGKRKKRADDEALDQDGWDDPSDLVESEPRPVKVTLKLLYKDARGEATERIVDVFECDTSNSKGYLIGFCHLRKAIRTFRIDRVLMATDMESGEVIGGVTAYAAQKYEESPQSALDKLLQTAGDPLRALFYVGKADGRFTAKEKQVFLQFCHAFSGDTRIELGDVNAICRDLEIPTKQSFKLICGRLAKLDNAARAAILDAADKMVATEKKISDEEHEALEYMRSKLALLEAA